MMTPVDMDLVQTRLNSSKLMNADKKTRDQKKLLETCKEFESIFVKQMLKSMKNTVQKSGLIKESMAENIFEDMLYDKYAAKITATGGLGIGDMIYRQLSVHLDNTKPAEIQ